MKGNSGGPIKSGSTYGATVDLSGSNKNSSTGNPKSGQSKSHHELRSRASSPAESSLEAHYPKDRRRKDIKPLPTIPERKSIQFHSVAGGARNSSRIELSDIHSELSAFKHYVDNNLGRLQPLLGADTKSHLDDLRNGKVSFSSMGNELSTWKSAVHQMSYESENARYSNPEHIASRRPSVGATPQPPIPIKTIAENIVDITSQLFNMQQMVFNIYEGKKTPSGYKSLMKEVSNQLGGVPTILLSNPGQEEVDSMNEAIETFGPQLYKLHYCGRDAAPLDKNYASLDKDASLSNGASSLPDNSISLLNTSISLPDKYAPRLDKE